MSESMWANEPYMHKDGDFRLTATSAGDIARMYQHGENISLTLAELLHLSSMFHVVQKHGRLL